MDHPVFDHEGPWTESAFRALLRDALPHEALPRAGRIEVVEGTLLVGPGPSRQRSRVVSRLRAAVQAALPEGLRVRGPVPLRLGPDCVLVPDLVVTAAGTGAGDDPAEKERGGRAAREEVLEAAAALMVIEVVGQDNGATDRTFKPQLYARSRIPYSLVVDHDAPFAVADMIISGRYYEYARAGAGETLRIEEPFVLEFDLMDVAGPEAGPSPAEPGEPPAPRAGGTTPGTAAAGTGTTAGTGAANRG